jgi:hypothetical protein
MKELFRINPKANPKAYNHGSSTIYVINDFYQQPEQVRDYALNLHFGPGEDAHFPGLITKCETGLEWIYDFCASAFGMDIPAGSFNSEEFRIINRNFQELDETQVFPHIDAALDNAITIVVYLNLPHQCKGGIGFYRHRETGLDRLDFSPDVLDQMSKYGYDSPKSLHTQMIRERFDYPRGYISDSNEHWELTKLIEMKFNRLVMYHGNRFHAPYLKPDFFDFDSTSKRAQRLFHRFFLLRRKSVAQDPRIY